MLTWMRRSCIGGVSSVVVVHLELSLKPVDGLLVHLESLGENLVRDGWLGPEHSVGDGDGARVLAAESTDGDGVGVPRIELEVDEALREHKHITLLQHLGEETIAVVAVGCDEADEELSFYDGEDLGGAGVSVGRVEAFGRVVDANHGDAQGVESGELVHVDGSDIGAELLSCVASLVESPEEEVFGFHHLGVLADEPIHQHCNRKKQTRSVNMHQESKRAEGD
ncbi:hypothetical protein MUK42_19161 [Musa troglodytarum]|uniref:Uncharacterized protein n=1 Tax=Musa troglodytarum TaxID=320322 RepID=A0A9E7K5V3_9LILI|nr:hypothetical protein MUK42_19161 [Musa troglodytarum]